MEPQEEKNDDEFVASCIRFEFVESTFAASFAHQIVPNHRIPVVSIQLAPSGRSCQIQIKRPLEGTLDKAVSVGNKRQKADVKDEDASSVDLGSEDSDTDADETYEDDDQSPSQEQQQQQQQQQPRPLLSAEETRTKLQGFLPPQTLSLDFLSVPIGKVVMEYVRNGAEFCLTLADGDQCRTYHEAVQKLAVFFIENADDIELSDEWKILYLFRKHSSDEYSLAGYTTLFHFSSPFRKPKAGTVVRVCQALIFPPYQRAGHGSTMLQFVFDYAQSSTNIVEVNCEDPAPSFAKLRLVVDWERCCKEPWFKEDEASEWNEASFLPLSESKAMDLTTTALTTKKQIQCVFEIHMLSKLQKLPNEKQTEWSKKYRLMVKRRLNRHNQEELSACPDKTAMKALLAELYDNVYEIYCSILRRGSSSWPAERKQQPMPS